MGFWDIDTSLVDGERVWVRGPFERLEASARGGVCDAFEVGYSSGRLPSSFAVAGRTYRLEGEEGFPPPLA